MKKRNKIVFKKKIFIYSIIIILATIFSILLFYHFNIKLVSDEKIPSAEIRKKFKILHIMSYHSGWQWTDDQFTGFKDALKELDIEYKTFEMNSKTISSLTWLEKTSKEAIEIIESWKPDLVYTSDDNVQEYVAKKFVNKKIPFIFSGVNAEPTKYRFNGSKNITGVLEHEHFFQSVKLLREIIPSIKKIAVIADDDPAWISVINRCKDAAAKELPEIQFVSWDIIKTFNQYKKIILNNEKNADALCIISWFTFKDDKGNNISEMEIAKWTAENSRIPDLSFWKDRVSKGTLCSVYVSAYEQGHSAGKIAYKVLSEGLSPDFFPIQPTIKGKPVINLVRAKALNIKIKSTILLNSEVLEKYLWQ